LKKEGRRHVRRGGGMKRYDLAEVGLVEEALLVSLGHFELMHQPIDGHLDEVFPAGRDSYKASSRFVSWEHHNHPPACGNSADSFDLATVGGCLTIDDIVGILQAVAMEAAIVGTMTLESQDRHDGYSHVLMVRGSRAAGRPDDLVVEPIFALNSDQLVREVSQDRLDLRAVCNRPCYDRGGLGVDLDVQQCKAGFCQADGGLRIEGASSYIVSTDSPTKTMIAVEPYHTSGVDGVTILCLHWESSRFSCICLHL